VVEPNVTAKAVTKAATFGKYGRESLTKRLKRAGGGCFQRGYPQVAQLLLGLLDTVH